jgi:hypothetical protein
VARPPGRKIVASVAERLVDVASFGVVLVDASVDVVPR